MKKVKNKMDTVYEIIPTYKVKIVKRPHGEAINDEDKAARYFRAIYENLDEDVESITALFLNIKLKPIAYKLFGTGADGISYLTLRNLFRQALLCGANGIILCHNHPSLDETPSKSDDIITQKVKEAADLIGIDLIDHIILGKGVYSFASHNRI